MGTLAQLAAAWILLKLLFFFSVVRVVYANGGGAY